MKIFIFGWPECNRTWPYWSRSREVPQVYVLGPLSCQIYGTGLGLTDPVYRGKLGWCLLSGQIPWAFGFRAKKKKKKEPATSSSAPTATVCVAHILPEMTNPSDVKLWSCIIWETLMTQKGWKSCRNEVKDNELRICL